MFKKVFVFLIFLIFGLLIFFFPMFNNPDLMPGDLKDARLVNYILEHGYLFFLNDDFHNSFWNMPVFYPNTNTLAYSEVLFAQMLLYTPFRMFFSPQTSLQIIVILMCILNYFSFFLLSKDIFKFNHTISSIGAFLFAFSLARYNQLEHLQLLSQFLSVFSLYFFLKKPYKLSNFIFSSLFLSLQFYTCYYFGWFMVFCAILAFFIMLLKKDTRDIICCFIKENKRNLLIFFTIFLISILPLFYHYISVKGGFELKHWFLFHKFSFLFSYSILDSIFVLPNFSAYSIETVTGIGFFITLFVFIGWIKLKKYRFQILLFSAVLISCFWLRGIYDFIFTYLPSANAIRAGARSIFMLLIIYCYLICWFLKETKNKILFWIIVTVIILETIPYPVRFNWSKKEHNKRIEKYHIDNNCRAFYIKSNNEDYKKNAYVWLDAMWLSNKIKKPTLNGFSGYNPGINESILDKNCIINTD